MRKEKEAAAFAAVNTDDGNLAVTRISRLFRARKQEPLPYPSPNPNLSPNPQP